MKKVKIYVLIDSRTNEIRYVGKTIQKLNNRLSSHCSINENDLTHKSNWIRELKNNNLKPLIQLIEVVNEDVWEEREIYWIEYYSSLYKLTNMDKGGKGSHKVKHETKLQKSITSKKMWENPEYREKMKLVMKDSHSDESKNKQSNVMKERWSDIEYKKMMSEISKKANPIIKEPKEIKYPNVSDSQKKIWSNENYRKDMTKKQPNSQIIICDDIEYQSIGQASRLLGLYKTTIIKRLKSKHFPNYNYKNMEG